MSTTGSSRSFQISDILEDSSTWREVEELGLAQAFRLGNLCGDGFQAPLRDAGRFIRNPGVETPGYFQWSLRDQPCAKVGMKMRPEDA